MTLAPHLDLSPAARDLATATRIAQSRAAAKGIKLVVAAVIGTNSCVQQDPAEERLTAARAA
jgi:hypothetical protein